MMSGSIDEYRFENVTADTYYAICDVRRNIKRFVEDSHTIDLNRNPVDGQREHKELNEVVTKNIIDAIKYRLYNIILRIKLFKVLTLRRYVVLLAAMILVLSLDQVKFLRILLTQRKQFS